MKLGHRIAIGAADTLEVTAAIVEIAFATGLILYARSLSRRDAALTDREREAENQAQPAMQH